jgi:hypothetical protein
MLGRARVGQLRTGRGPTPCRPTEYRSRQHIREVGAGRRTTGEAARPTGRAQYYIVTCYRRKAQLKLKKQQEQELQKRAAEGQPGGAPTAKREKQTR